jgi:hypothetical protein
VTPSIPMLAWSPDTDPTVPGVMTDVENLLPTTRGYAPDCSLAAAIATQGTLPSQAYGGALARTSYYTPAFIAATDRALYRISGGSATDVSRAAPAYPIDTSGWSVEVFGDTNLGEVILACNYSVPLQKNANIYGSAFSDITDAPTAPTMAVQSNFVMIGGIATSTTTSGSWAYADGWWCSALGDCTDWEPDVATQCARGRLTQTPGGIIRVVAYQNDLLFFKERSIIRGTFVGPPSIWNFTVVSNDVGLASKKNSVVQVAGVLYWMGLDGFYQYNGGTVRRIASAPWVWLLGEINNMVGFSAIQAHYDPQRRVVRWYYNDNAGSGLNAGLAYHPETDRWGRFSANAEWVANALYEYAPFTPAAVIADGPAYDSAIVIDATTHAVQAYTGTPGASSFTTGDIGDDDVVSTMVRARLRTYIAPTTSSMTHYHRMNMGDALTTGATVSRSDGRYDVSHGARWHRLKLAQTGAYEIGAMSIDPKPSGIR